jgi:hypothetical protein
MQTSLPTATPRPDRERSEQPVSLIPPITPRQTMAVRAALPGLVLAMSAVLFGFAMGGIFGARATKHRQLRRDRGSVAWGI